MSKKILSLLIVFLTAFLVFVQPLNVDAATGSVVTLPLYIEPDQYSGDLTEDITSYFRYMDATSGFYSGYSLSDMNVLVFYDSSLDYYYFIYVHNSRPLVFSDVNSVNCSDSAIHHPGIGGPFNGYQGVYYVSDSSGNYINHSAIFNVFCEFNPCEDIIIWTNQDIYSDSYIETLYCVSEVFSGGNTGSDEDYSAGFFDKLEEFEDFYESTDSAKESIELEELVTEEEEPNVFLRVFKNIGVMLSNSVTLLNDTRDLVYGALDEFFNITIPKVFQNGFNGIKEVLSNVLTSIGDLSGSFLSMLQEWFDWIYTHEFSDGLSIQSIVQFFKDSINDIAEFLGEITGEGISVLDAVMIVLPEPLAAIVDEIYTSGVGAGGTFRLLTCLEYWFVPDTEVMRNRINEINEAEPSIMQIRLAGTSLRDDLISIEPVAPVFTMPSATFVVPGTNGEKSYTLPEISIGFEWFESWKPYTDFFIAAFLYVAYFWHLLTSLPSLFSGGSVTVAHVPETKDKPLDTNWSNGIFRR